MQGRGFVLYLRSFGSENFRFDERRADAASAVEVRPLAREFDSRLVRLVSRTTPCFGLANLDDPSPPDDLSQLFVLNRDWVGVADHLMQKANRVILYLSRETPGLLREMTVLAHLEIQDRVLIVLGKDESAGARPDQLAALLSRFSHQLREGDRDFEAAVAAFMRPEGGVTKTNNY